MTTGYTLKYPCLIRSSIYRPKPITKAAARPTTEVITIVFTPMVPAALSLLSPEDVELEELSSSVPLPFCCLILTYSTSPVLLLGPLAFSLKRISAQLYRALPVSPTVTTWILAMSPSLGLTSEGSSSLSMNRVPEFVALRNSGVREMLKLVEFSPRPRLTKM